MGSLGILFLLWVAKRGMYLEGDVPRGRYASFPFPHIAATPSFAVSQSGGESRLKNR